MGSQCVDGMDPRACLSQCVSLSVCPCLGTILIDAVCSAGYRSDKTWDRVFQGFEEGTLVPFASTPRSDIT